MFELLARDKYGNFEFDFSDLYAFFSLVKVFKPEGQHNNGHQWQVACFCHKFTLKCDSFMRNVAVILTVFPTFSSQLPAWPLSWISSISLMESSSFPSGD